MTNINWGDGFIICVAIWSSLGSTFVIFFGSGLRFGGERRPGSEQSAEKLKNTLNKIRQKGYTFQNTSEFLVVVFLLVVGGVSGSVFFALWWPKCPKKGSLRHSFPAMLQQSWEVNTPNTSFQSFEGLSQDVLATFFNIFSGMGFET